jgi:1-acyl-sn-glycerol-3-phosphate acyltransferase
MTPYAFAKGLVHVVTRALWRVQATGQENVPLHGPLIVAANHISYLDPPVLGAYCPRQISYMAKEELFEMPVVGRLIGALGAYPVDRQGSARSAVKRSVEVLRAGGAIGIFPEGTRNFDGTARVQTGVALLASITGAPVLPAALVGTGAATRFHQIKVAYGTPMRFPPGKATRDDLAKFTADVMSAIRALAGSIGGNSQG